MYHKGNFAEHCSNYCYECYVINFVFIPCVNVCVLLFLNSAIQSVKTAFSKGFHDCM